MLYIVTRSQTIKEPLIEMINSVSKVFWKSTLSTHLDEVFSSHTYENCCKGRSCQCPPLVAKNLWPFHLPCGQPRDSYYIYLSIYLWVFMFVSCFIHLSIPHILVCSHMPWICLAPVDRSTYSLEIWARPYPISYLEVWPSQAEQIRTCSILFNKKAY